MLVLSKTVVFRGANNLPWERKVLKDVVTEEIVFNVSLVRQMSVKSID